MTFLTQIKNVYCPALGVFPQHYSEEEATGILSQKEVRIICDMKMGMETATAWGCDLSYEYVRINGDYRS